MDKHQFVSAAPWAATKENGAVIELEHYASIKAAPGSICFPAAHCNVQAHCVSKDDDCHLFLFIQVV